MSRVTSARDQLCLNENKLKSRLRINELLKQIKDAEKELEELHDYEHNDGVDGAVKHFRDELVSRATPAELKFKNVIELKRLNIRFQYRINIMCRGGRRIKKVYFADFCDTKNKLIFEIDGEYHNDEDQIVKDSIRTKDLNNAGYKVFRITNEDVMNGKSTSFLYKAYKSIGINIL